MNKNASSKILLSLGVPNLLYSGAFEADITFNSDSDLEQHFDINEKENVTTFKNENYKNKEDITFKINTSAFDDSPTDAQINIDLGNNSLTLENTRSDSETAALVKNFNVDARI